MIKLHGASEFLTGIEAAIKSFNDEVVETLRGFGILAFARILHDTPQWSGNAVSNWNFSVNTVDSSVYPFEGSSVVTSKGHPVAIGVAVTRNYGRNRGVKHATDRIYISNAAETISHKSYIQMVEANPNNYLRPVNQPGHMVEFTANELSAMGILTEAQIGFLRGLTISDAEGAWSI